MELNLLKRVGKWFLIVLMLLNGLFYMSNIIVIGDREAIVNMHEDIPQTAGNLIANIKVIDVFVTGILFLLSSIAIIRKKYKYAFLGVLGAIIFFLMYIVQIVLWIDSHPSMLIGLFTFGLVALLHGVVSFYYWRRRK